MTQTSPQSTDRLTSRQRRIEEQRRKIDVARAQQRRTRMLWVGGIVVVVALAIVVVVLLMPRGASASQMRQVTTEQGAHVDDGAPLSYSHRPPSSGMHYGTAPQPTDYRMYDAPLTPGRWVHMLEHGAVVVLYRPDLCNDACVQQLGAFYDSAPRSNLVGVRHLAITPYQDMDHAIAVVAWGYVDEMDQVDTDRVMADYKSKVDAPSAPERGAM
ncbi:MAG TPA: DUF3105 domain-containing protein [Chloroflexota bacterium]